MSESTEALDGFIDKWRGRWPEWTVAEAFVPPAQRETILVWAALQQELIDAAWGGEDPRPGEAKLGWWQEELAGWSKGARRHPLGAVLQRQPVRWAALAGALPALAASRERAATTDEAFAALMPFAHAVAAVDADLSRTAVDEFQDRLVAATLLQWRMVHGEAGVPLSVLARAGEGDPTPLWGAELRRAWPRQRAASRPRRLWAGLARARLDQANPAQPRPGWKTLLMAWRAARD